MSFRQHLVPQCLSISIHNKATEQTRNDMSKNSSEKLEKNDPAA
jgi:hypothetical protein